MPVLDMLADTVLLEVALAVAVIVVVAVTVRLLVVDADIAAETLELAVTVLDADKLGDAVTDALAEHEVLAVLEVEGRLDPVGVTDIVLETVTVADVVSEGEYVADADVEATLDNDAESVAVGVNEVVIEGVAASYGRTSRCSY